jgi:hypothetical protein
MPMPSRPYRLLVAAALLIAAGLAAQFALGKKKVRPPDITMDEQKRAVHALNRLAFGLRPGDVERVTKMGVDNWIDILTKLTMRRSKVASLRFAPSTWTPKKSSRIFRRTS